VKEEKERRCRERGEGWTRKGMHGW